MERRQFLAGAGTVAALFLAGCGGPDDGDDGISYDIDPPSNQPIAPEARDPTAP